MLRGRGGCYKHAFYGIESHRCMEATPSLACANKCVFCWRHHSNPVATSWKWATDPADQIVEQALAQHVAMVKEYSGVPGVLPHRLQEGYQVGGGWMGCAGRKGRWGYGRRVGLGEAGPRMLCV
jgi:tRNA wybutosine-synthesizing protein 1